MSHLESLLESDLDGARRTKWELVNKIKLLENNAFECLDKGEGVPLSMKRLTSLRKGLHYE